MAIDRITAKNRPEILSPDYKSKTGSVNNRQRTEMEPIYLERRFSREYDCKKLNSYDMENSIFQKILFHLWKSSDDLWISELRQNHLLTAICNTLSAFNNIYIINDPEVIISIINLK